MEEIKILEIDDTSYECRSLIEFTSLIKILFKLSEKQKYIESKIDYINNRVDEKETRLSNLEIQLNGVSKSEDHKIVQSFQSSPKISNQKLTPKTETFIEYASKESQSPNLITEEKVKEKEKENECDKEKEKDKEKGKEIIYDKENEKEKEKEKEIVDDKEKEREKEEIESENFGNMNPDMIKKLFKKVKEHEKKISELTKKSSEHIVLDKKTKHNTDLIEENLKKIENLQKQFNDLLNTFKDFKNDFDEVKIKVLDFNLYDIFKSDGANGGNLDVAKSLVMALETKVFKKFSFYDERAKNLDKDMFKLKEDLKNNNNTIDGIKHMIEKNHQELKDNNNNEELFAQLNAKIELIQNELDEIKKNGVVNDGNELLNDLINKKIKENVDKVKKIIKKEIVDKELGYQKKESAKTLKIGQENFKNNSKRINDIEMMIRDAIEQIDAKNMKERITTLENEIVKKMTKVEGTELKNKIMILEEEIKDESLKIELQQQAFEKMRNDNIQLVKKIEFLNSEFAKLSFKKITSNNDKPDISVDLMKYLEKNEYNYNKVEVNNKFEKVRLAIENLGRNLENILTSISHTVSDKDLINYQGVVKNTIDELKISLNKKYADKIDTNKTLKYLETQLKTVMEFTNKRTDGAENWLLAKKPLNNYLCASCESVIRGELDKKTDYIPWNKYPSREDKPHRMGHGFSRMLQMVNDDIMRSTNTDNINNNIFLNTNINNLNSNFNISNTKDNQKDEDNTNAPNNNSNNIIGNLKLPKVKNKGLNINTNQSVNNLDVNNHKDKKKDENENKNENRNMTSPYDDHSMSTSNLNRPQIMKIYKLNKNTTITQTNSASADINAGIQIISSSQKKINTNENVINKTK